MDFLNQLTEVEWLLIEAWLKEHPGTARGTILGMGIQSDGFNVILTPPSANIVVKGSIQL